MKEELQEIKVILAKIEVDLRHHIRRTDILEDSMKELLKEIKPVQRHVSVVNAIGKLMLGISAISAAIATILSLTNKL